MFLLLLLLLLLFILVIIWFTEHYFSIYFFWYFVVFLFFFKYCIEKFQVLCIMYYIRVSLKKKKKILEIFNSHFKGVLINPQSDVN